MEASKGVIFDRGEDEIDGIKVHKYLVTMLVITSEPLKSMPEEVIMITAERDSPIVDALRQAKTYKHSYPLGSCDMAIMTAMDFCPDDVEPIK